MCFGEHISAGTGTNQAASGVYSSRVSEHSAAGGAVFSLGLRFAGSTWAALCWQRDGLQQVWQSRNVKDTRDAGGQHNGQSGERN